MTTVGLVSINAILTVQLLASLCLYCMHCRSSKNVAALRNYNFCGTVRSLAKNLLHKLQFWKNLTARSNCDSCMFGVYSNRLPYCELRFTGNFSSKTKKSLNIVQNAIAFSILSDCNEQTTASNSCFTDVYKVLARTLNYTTNPNLLTFDSFPATHK